MMLRCKKLTQRMFAFGLAGFIGQLLLVCCLSVVHASSTVEDTSKAVHCHEDMQQHEHGNQQDDAQRQPCCHGAASVVFDATPKSARAEFEGNPYVAVVDSIDAQQRVVFPDIFPEPAFKRNRAPSTPIYLAYCTFLE